MGCFLSLHFGIRESERRRARREEQQNLTNSERNNTDVVGGDNVMVFCAQSDTFSATNYPDGKNENDLHRLGAELKRIDFKWRLSESISKADLETRKNGFWETCYANGGQSQVWDALKMICQDESRDLILAQSILESCGVILPYGQLTEIYDSKGFRYHLPPYCVCDPINLNDKADNVSSEASNSESSDKQLKIRLSDGKDILMDFDSIKSVSDIKSHIRKQENIDPKRRMVVLWCGKVLEDTRDLRALSLPKGAVLQVMVP